jgi:hypothetical protein
VRLPIPPPPQVYGTFELTTSSAEARGSGCGSGSRLSRQNAPHAARHGALVPLSHVAAPGRTWRKCTRTARVARCCGPCRRNGHGSHTDSWPLGNLQWWPFWAKVAVTLGRGMLADLNEVAYGHGCCWRVILWSSGSPVQHFPFPIRPWKVSFVRVNDPTRAATPHISNQGSALDTVLRSE